MSGILASSTSRQMTSGETAATGSAAGFVVGEEISLSTTPTGTDYAWGQAIPSASGTSRSELSDDTGASVTFTPDVGGIYLVTCTVDSTTTYTLTLSVTDTVQVTPAEALRLQKKAQAGVPAPTAGALALFVEYATGGLTQKDGSATLTPLVPGIVGAALADADATIQIGAGSHRCVVPATLTANRQVTLGTTSAALGMVLWLHRFDVTAFTLAIINGGVGAGTLLTLPVSEAHSAAFKFDGTNWALHERYRLV